MQDMARDIGFDPNLSRLVILVLGLAVVLYLVGEVFRRLRGRPLFSIGSEPDRS